MQMICVLVQMDIMYSIWFYDLYLCIRKSFYIANNRICRGMIKSCIFLPGQNIHKFGSALVICSRHSYKESIGIYTEYQCYHYKITCRKTFIKK